jgi:hypothetical protein
MVGIMYPIQLYKTVRRFKKSERESREMLHSFASEETPELESQYIEWSNNNSVIGSVAAVPVLGKEFCKLEDRNYDKQEKIKMTLLGAVSRLINDLCGGKIVGPRESSLYFQEGKVDLTGDWRKKFGYELGLELERNLPLEFRETHASLVDALNKVMIENESLTSKETSKEDIVRIRNLKGGLYNLAIYSTLFPEFGDPLSRLSTYVPNRKDLPETKEQALFNLGAFFTKLDDFFDAKQDSVWGIRQQFTEGVLTVKDLDEELQFANRGLRKHYGKRVVSLEEITKTMLDTFKIARVII